MSTARNAGYCSCRPYVAMSFPITDRRRSSSVRKANRCPSSAATCREVWHGPGMGIDTTSRQARTPGSPIQSMMTASAPRRCTSGVLRIVPGTLSASWNSDSMDAGPAEINVCDTCRSTRWIDHTSSSERMPAVTVGVMSSIYVLIDVVINAPGSEFLRAGRTAYPGQMTSVRGRRTPAAIEGSVPPRCR